MRITVDRDLCEANAVCAGLVPEIFDVDDEDILHIAPGEVQDVFVDRVRRAAESCPKTALRIED